MPLPEMHGRTHCPGGSDPIPCLAGAWARRKRATTTQTVAGNSSQVTITYQTAFDVQDTTNSFAFAQVSGFDCGIKILSDGIYGILCRVFCGSLDTEFTISVWGIDPPTDWAPYQECTSTLGASTELTGKASLTARLAANQVVFATIRQNSGSNKTIDAGTYLEVIRLGGATMEGRLATS